jgi:hypothetical protein
LWPISDWQAKLQLTAALENERFLFFYQFRPSAAFGAIACGKGVLPPLRNPPTT